MDALERMLLSLDGLSVGDAFGDRFFGPGDAVFPRISGRVVPPGLWRYSDDTEMALSIVEVLARHGEIRQDELAQLFALRFDPARGYGGGAYGLLKGIGEGGDWRLLSRAMFRGMGSFGNGGAMRVAPLGGYFAEAGLETVVRQARLSAEVTHAHPEGIAGAIAVAVAATLAWQTRQQGTLGRGWIEEVLEWVPAGYTHDGIVQALELSPMARLVDAAEALGNGSGVTAPDTVPLCLWVAARHCNDFTEAIWTTVSALGDRDTTCAIVGGILALRLGPQAIPAAWLQARESLEPGLGLGIGRNSAD